MDWTFLKWKCIEFLVIDEADRILDLGFKDNINIILEKLPNQRRTVKIILFFNLLSSLVYILIFVLIIYA